MRKLRMMVLLTALLALSGWWVFQYWHGYVFFPGQCNGEKPEWFDELVVLARQHGYPGFQLSLQAPDGRRLDCAAGQAEPGFSLKAMQSAHRVRYASLSKLFTSIVTQQLIHEKRLHPDDLLLDYLDTPLALKDERIRQITIDQLLHHTAGFDRSLTPDPMLENNPWCPFRLEGLSFVVLDHKPGQYYAYSNLGYCLLGAVIEKIEKQTLADVLRERVFLPASITSLEPSYRGFDAKDEVVYFFQEPEHRQQLVSIPYENLLAVGAWTGTATSFLQLMSVTFTEGKTLDDLNHSELLAVKPNCDSSQWRLCHGRAFYTYQPEKSMARFYWRDGSLPGVTSFFGLGQSGQMMLFVANSRPYNWMPANDRLGLFLYQNMVANESY